MNSCGSLSKPLSESTKPELPYYPVYSVGHTLHCATHSDKIELTQYILNKRWTLEPHNKNSILGIDNNVT